MSSQAAALAELIRAADSVVALTGAGISVPSGIPDFRTPGTGLWTNVDPMEVAHIDVFRRDPGALLALLRRSLPDARAQAAQRRACGAGAAGGGGPARRRDDPEHRPPARPGGHPHPDRGPRHDRALVVSDLRHALPAGRGAPAPGRRRRGVPRCACGRPLKPDVVLFGEYLPVQALARAEQLAEGADLLLCVGSSLEVYPVAPLPQTTLGAGGRWRSSPRGARRLTTGPRCAVAVTSSTSCEAVLAALAPERRAAPSGVGDGPRP